MQQNDYSTEEKARRYDRACAVLAEHKKLVTIIRAGEARGLLSNKAESVLAKLADALEGEHA